MLYVARFYSYMDVMIRVLVGLGFIIAVIKTSIVTEEIHVMRGKTHSIRILNNVSDPTVTVKSLLRLPGTDFVYIPIYSYSRNGVEHQTISYKKCYRETQANLRK